MRVASAARGTAWAAAGLAGLTGAWMLFDGVHALVLGDYVTPSSGDYAGQLGPWAGLLETAGLPPRSAAVKWAFVVYGASLLALAGAYSTRRPWARRPLLVAALLGLWYVPFGTLLNAAAIFLVLVGARRDRRQSAEALADRER